MSPVRPQPVYSAKDVVNPAYQLRYTWSGWPSLPEQFPSEPGSAFFRELDSLWELDGIRRLEHKWTPELIQITFSVTPQVSPVLFTSRVKGRLQHALRIAKLPTQFSRKTSLRTIGDNTDDAVREYILRQVDKERFVDPKFEQLLKRYTTLNADVKLDQPTETGSGRYWYNLHLVLVVEKRSRFTDENSLRKIHEGCSLVARKKGHLLAVQSVMPDHVHLALRGNIDQSAEEIALAMMNNLAYFFGQQAIWQPGYYVGTFGQYNMHAIRSR